MNNAAFSVLDYVIFVVYACIVLFVGWFVSRPKEGHERTAEDYFVAGKSLPWWVIGATLICSNISAEQFIGMSGSGFKIGLAISSYEWMAAITLVLVAKFLLPIFIKENIWTMPQFLAIRYNDRVRTTMAIYWLAVYVFVNLTTILYLGALTIETVFGVPLFYGIVALAVFSGLYSIKGGLESVAWTDMIQVTVLVTGGLITTYIGLNAISAGHGVLAGFSTLMERAPEHFDMIVRPRLADGSVNEDYMNLPGFSVLIGGMWIVNMSYWGFNQYITQRAFAAKSLQEAQKGVLFAGFLKLLVPFIVVIPGIVTYYCFQEELKGNNLLGKDFSIVERMVWKRDAGSKTADVTTIKWGGKTLYQARNQKEVIELKECKDVNAMIRAKAIKPDSAYPAMLAYVPNGVKGLAFAALVAAIVAALSSMINSISTIFTMDLYQHYINKNASQAKLVTVGRITAVVSLFIALFVAPFLQNVEQVFQYIQEFTGFISPAILAIFVFGFFWKRTTPNAALWAAILAIPFALGIKQVFPDLPFMDRMGVVFISLSVMMVIISLIESKGQNNPNAITLDKSIFATTVGFNVASIIICIILAFFYLRFSSIFIVH